MYITKSDGSLLEVKVIQYDPTITINYTLIKTSSGKVVSQDRGASTDYYSCEFTFIGQPSYIDSILQCLNELRDAKKEVILTECEERFFGDNINHTVPIKCVVNKVDKQNQKRLNVQEIVITLIPTDLQFYYDMPAVNEPKCLQNVWEGYQTWDTQVNSTYNSNNYFVDNQADRYFSKLTYIFDEEHNQKWLTFWKTNRGTPFYLDETVWGGQYLFGEDAGTGSHIVIIENIEYERITSFLKRTTFNLIKVG